MPKLEEQLRGLRLRELTDRDTAKMWQNVIQARTPQLTHNWFMQKILASALAGVFIFGSVGVVSASNGAAPGDILFPLDLALEKAQLALVNDDKAQELTLAFAAERVGEIRSLVSDLSQAIIARVEVDVFINETVVNIEANDKHFIYTTALTDRNQIVSDIAVKYSIPTATIFGVLDFQIEDRASRPEDKVAISSTISTNNSVSTPATTVDKNFSKGITELEALLASLRDPNQAQQIRQSLVDVMLLMGDGSKLELHSDSGRIKLENKDGEVQIKISDDDDSDDDNDNASPNTSTDVREDDDKVFCRGEWRDVEDCDEDSLDDEDDDQDEDEDEDEARDDDDDDSVSGSSGSGSGSSGNSGSSSSSGLGGATIYTLAQVATHNTISSCWAVVNGGVYDLTGWISSHPGGESAILSMCGKDSSSAFNGMHGSSSSANAALASYKIGTL